MPKKQNSTDVDAVLNNTIVRASEYLKLADGRHLLIKNIIEIFYFYSDYSFDEHIFKLAYGIINTLLKQNGEPPLSPEDIERL